MGVVRLEITYISICHKYKHILTTLIITIIATIFFSQIKTDLSRIIFYRFFIFSFWNFIFFYYVITFYECLTLSEKTYKLIIIIDDIAAIL